MVRTVFLDRGRHSPRRQFGLIGTPPRSAPALSRGRRLTGAGLLAGLTLGCPGSRDDLPSDRAAVVAEARRLVLGYEFDSARALIGPVSPQPVDAADSAFATRRLGLLGQIHFRLGEYDAARDSLRLSATLAEPRGMWDHLARVHSMMGLMAWHESDPFAAIEAFRAAREAGARGAEPETRNAIDVNEGLVRMDLGHFGAALDLFTNAAAVAARLGDTRVQAAALNNLGMAHLWMGDPAGALPPLQEAEALAQRAGDAAVIANNAGQLGLALAAVGEPGQAVVMLDRAVTQSRGLGSKQEEASNLEALATVLSHVGDTRGALSALRTAAAIDRELGLAWELATNLRLTADLHALLGDSALAVAFTDSARLQHQRLEYPQEEFADLLQLANLATARGDPAAARHLRDATHLATTTLDSRNTRVQLGLAHARHALQDQPRRTLEKLTEIRGDLAYVGYDAVGEADALMARAFDQLGARDSAISAARRAVTAADAAHATLNSGLLRGRYVQHRRAAYGHLVDLLARDGQVERAFEVADRLRTNTAGEAPTPRSRPVSSDADPTDLRRRIARLDQLVREVDISTRGGDRAALHRLEDSLAAARRQFETHLIASHEGQPVVPTTPRADAAGVGDALEPNEALIEYFIAEDELLRFVVSGGAIRLDRVSVTASALANRVRLARQLIARPDGSPADEVLASLWTFLVPALPSDVAALTVVPDGVLNYVPFAALRDSDPDQYLVERYELSFAPSASGLIRARARARPATTERPVVFAPFPSRLPGTAAEADAIRRTRAGTRIRRGRRAHEHAVRGALEDDHPVHLATHARLNVRNPLFSRIELAGGRTGQPSHADGYLEVHEVLDLDVRAPLVFLSGCETALGAGAATQSLAGEEYLTLARAFLGSGADNVIATLWPVADDGAAAFAEWFYESVGPARLPASLRAAQLRALVSDNFRSPFHWAGYQLIGSGR